MIDFTFSDTLTPKLEAARRATIDFTPAMATIADFMRGAAVERFETGTSPDGSEWKESRRAQEKGGKTLIDRQHLQDSITAGNDSTSAIAGTNIIYAAIHQFGDQRKVGVREHERKITKAFGKPLSEQLTVLIHGYSRQQNMPARPFLGFSDADKTGIEAILAEHISGAFEGRTK